MLNLVILFIWKFYVQVHRFTEQTGLCLLVDISEANISLRVHHEQVYRKEKTSGEKKITQYKNDPMMYKRNLIVILMVKCMSEK
jgi:hypothetical protein